MCLKYPEEYKVWELGEITQLFDAKLDKINIDTSKDVVKNLESQSKGISSLILWLDCDREGEAIAFDVIDVCTRACGRKIEILRAHFSALTY